MHRFYYALPAATAVLLYIYCPLPDDEWWVYLVMAAVSELILYLAISRAGKTKEYLSGYAVNIQHHNPWVERVTYTETYTDSKGQTHTRTKVRYVTHPDRWLMELNTGKVTDIDSDVYDSYRGIWRTPRQNIWPAHINCVSGGGGQQYDWDNVYDNALTETYTGLYENYVRNSDSIFKAGKVTSDEVERLGLVEYPSSSMFYLERDVVLVSPHLKIRVPENVQRRFQLLNAFNGLSHQIHVFVVLFSAETGLETALKQRDFWLGGNKNEFTVCLGIDGVQEPDDDNVRNPDKAENASEDNAAAPTVKWCKAFSWCDMPRMETALESWYIANPVLDFPALAQWLRANMNLWKRKEFSDFKYLGTRLSTGRNILVGILAVLLCAAMWYISQNM